jgi:alkylated DNA repair protein alkB family protein 1
VLLLSRLLHRDLSNPLHTTNLHSSHHMPYPAPPPSAPSANSHPASFFTLPQSSPSPSALFTPLPTAPPSAKPLNTSQVLHKKLRYLTLGAQYNWATRAYPASPRDSPTTFPADIRALVSTLFPTDPLTRAQFRPESGVVLLYGAKDYMPVHRDVSEECERGLASFSLGCDGLFVVGREKPGAEGGGDAGGEMDVVALRVRSGDVVYMAGETRWAWHAMPRVLAGTCPAWFRDWPMEKERGGEFEKEFKRWRGYMVGKRLNISCRQVWG